MLDIVYNFFDSARMVDQNLVEAIIDRFSPNKYIIEHGYIHIKSEMIRGNISAITSIEYRNRENIHSQGGKKSQEIGRNIFFC
jgi:hypothetical protein